MFPLKAPAPLCGPLPPVRMLPLYPTPGSLRFISMTARWGGEVDPPSVIKEVLGRQYSSSPLQPAAVLVHSSAHTSTRTDCLSLVSWLVVGCSSSSSPRFSVSQHLTQYLTRSGTSIKGFCSKDLRCCYRYIPPTSQEFFQKCSQKLVTKVKQFAHLNCERKKM